MNYNVTNEIISDCCGPIKKFGTKLYGKASTYAVNFGKDMISKYAHDASLNHGAFYETSVNGVFRELPSTGEILSMTSCKVVFEHGIYRPLFQRIAGREAGIERGDVDKGQLLGQGAKIIQPFVMTQLGIKRGTKEVHLGKSAIELVKVAAKSLAVDYYKGSPFVVNFAAEFGAKLGDHWLHYGGDSITSEDVALTTRKAFGSAVAAKLANLSLKYVLKPVIFSVASATLGRDKAEKIAKIFVKYCISEIGITYWMTSVSRPGTYQINDKIYDALKVTDSTHNETYAVSRKDLFAPEKTLKGYTIPQTDDHILLSGDKVCSKDLLTEVKFHGWFWSSKYYFCDVKNKDATVIQVQEKYGVQQGNKADYANNPDYQLVQNKHDGTLFACVNDLKTGWFEPDCSVHPNNDVTSPTTLIDIGLPAQEDMVSNGTIAQHMEL
jgi:hypothetical protein